MKGKRYIDFIVAAEDIAKFRTDREELNTNQFIADPERFDVGKLLGESMADMITVLRIGGRPEVEENDDSKFRVTMRLPNSLVTLVQNYLNGMIITIAETIVETGEASIPREVAFYAAVDFVYKMMETVIEYNGFSEEVEAKVAEQVVVDFDLH